MTENISQRSDNQSINRPIYQGWTLFTWYDACGTDGKVGAVDKVIGGIRGGYRPDYCRRARGLRQAVGRLRKHRWKGRTEAGGGCDGSRGGAGGAGRADCGGNLHQHIGGHPVLIGRGHGEVDRSAQGYRVELRDDSGGAVDEVVIAPRTGPKMELDLFCTIALTWSQGKRHETN